MRPVRTSGLPGSASAKPSLKRLKVRRNKFDYDREYKEFALGGLLPEGLWFPFDFGFIPSTIGGDGDPLDVVVLMDEPAHVGCLLDVRIIGVIEADQVEDGKKTTNDRFFAVSIHSYSHEKVGTIDDLNKSLIKQFEEFFMTYNERAREEIRDKRQARSQASGRTD